MNDIVLNTTAVVRDRFQITVPDEVRRVARWLIPNGVVSFVIKTKDEILIRPFVKNGAVKTDWKNIWEGITIVRTLKGKQGNLSEFVTADRLNH